MNGAESIRINKVYDVKGHALYDLIINDVPKMKAVPMLQVIQFLTNMHEG